MKLYKQEQLHVQRPTVTDCKSLPPQQNEERGGRRRSP